MAAETNGGCGGGAYGGVMGLRIGALIVDSRDPGRLARFWAEALDWVISQDQDPEWVIEPREGSREDCVVADLLFIKVPELKTIRIACISACDPRTNPPRLLASNVWAPAASMSARTWTAPGW